MERKRFMIAMDLETHLNLKSTASKCGIHSGDLIDLCLKGLENKITNAYKTAGIKGRKIMIDQQIIFLLLDADRLGWSEEKLTQALKEVGKDENDFEWTEKF